MGMKRKHSCCSGNPCFILWILGFLCFSLPVMGQHSQRPPALNSDEVLDVIYYPGKKETRQLTLKKIALPPPDPQDDDRLIQPLPPNSKGTQPDKTDWSGFDNSTGNTIFLVIESPITGPTEITRGQVVGILYGFFDPWTAPFAHWAGKLVWAPDQKEGFVVLSRSTSRTTLCISAFDLKNKSFDFPAKFETTKRSEFPQPTRLLSQISDLELYGGGGTCGLSKINGLIEKDSVFIQGERSTCDQVFLRFNLATKKWTQLVFGEKPIKSGDAIEAK